MKGPAVLAIALALAGCAAPPAGMKPWYTLSIESFAPIKAGATKADAEKLVGTPMLVSKYAGPQQEVWTYQHLGGTQFYLTDVVFGPDGRVAQMAQYPDRAFIDFHSP
jgi:outer membrane protein assembly factor BamE (lipoprotein component of BamABCDE complex)